MKNKCKKRKIGTSEEKTEGKEEDEPELVNAQEEGRNMKRME